VYSPNRFFTPIAQELRNQWKANLGVDVALQPIDDQTFSDGLNRHSYALFLTNIPGIENFPQHWFDVVLRDTGYRDPSVDALVSEASQRLLDRALPDYLKAARILVTDTVVATLMYGSEIIISKPYVKGAGAAGGSEYPWTEIKILKHSGS
jgi:ABC-type oligopeptide transport system substrate-binding subunit